MTDSNEYETVHIFTDVVHPESGEVLAEFGDVLSTRAPRARHVLAIVAAYADCYRLVHSDNGVAVAIHKCMA